MFGAFLMAAALTAPPSYFLGTWRCEVTGLSGTRISTSRNTLELDGRWIHMHAEGSSRVPGKQFVSETFVGYNELLKKYAKVTVNNFGGYWIAESDGWHGDQWTWSDATTEDMEWGVTEITRIAEDHYRSVEKTRGKGSETFSISSRMDCAKTH